MTDTVYLVINARRVLIGRATSKQAPTIHAGEVAVKLTITVDDQFIQNAMPQVAINVQEKHIIPAPITVEPESHEETPQ